MVNEWWFAVIVGAALGFLSGLGVGGGSLLLLWLTLIVGMEQSQARLMNLMFFVPCALIATILRWNQCRPDWRLAMPAILAGLAGSIIGNLTGSGLDISVLKKAFGILFILCGIRELMYKEKNRSG